MRKPPDSGRTPADLARAALRSMAEQGIAPTPDQYRRAYRAAAPDAPPSPATLTLLARLEQTPGVGANPVWARLRGTIAAEEWERAVETLMQHVLATAAPAAPAAAASDLGPLLARFVREWERSQSSLSHVAKLQALQAIEGSGAEALQQLRATTERWAALRERPASAPSHEEPAAGAPVRSAGEPWKRLWLDAVRMAEHAYAEQLTISGQARALLQAAADVQDVSVGFSAQAQALWDACEHWHQASGRSRARLSEVFRLLLNNLAELFPAQHWIHGQLAAVYATLDEPLNPERIEQQVASLKDLLFRQGVLQKAGEDARSLARELIDMVVRSLGSYVEHTERYGDRLQAGLKELSESDDWSRAKSVVQGILAQSQAMLEDTRNLRHSFAQAQGQLEQAQNRARNLENELEQLSELLQQDPLTGALNRRGLDIAFARESARAQRSNEPLCVAMLDIDHFKAINDTYGHDTGDTVLKELVQLLRKQLRPTDAVARMGGEEFLLLLPGEDLRHTQAIVARVQALFAARKFVHPRQPAGIFARFSAGLSAWKPGESFEDVYARADQALLQAKAGGRNRIEILADAPRHPE